MNRSELRTLVSNMIEDPNITKFTSSRYNDSLEKAQLQFAMDSKCLYKTQSYTLVADTASYDLPSDYFGDKSVMLNGIELDPVSRDSLGRLYKGQRWDQLKGTPIRYISDPMEANKTLVLVPIPSNTDSGTDLQLTYYAIPGTMSSDSASPFNSSTLLTQFHIAVAAYAGWLLLGYLQPSDPNIIKRKDLLATYTGKVNEAIQTFGDTKSEPMSLRPNSVRIR